MRNTEIKKALSMLREAHALLKNSKVDNLRKSANYLNQSLQVLQRKSD
ncbi:MAG TPA: hypothetical protein VGA63_03795 [Geopsychrobacteraceae bacterium]|jgi:hypothetical protein